MNRVFRHIELQSAPAFIMLILAGFAFILLDIFEINTYIILILSLVLIVLGTYFYFNSKKILAYCLISMSVGTLVFINIDNNSVVVPNKIIPKQKGIIGGKITKILKKDSLKTRYLIAGFIDTKELKKIKKTTLILNVYGKNNFAVGEKILSKCSVRLARKKVLPSDFDEQRYAKGMGTLWIANTNEKSIISTAKPNKLLQLRNYVFGSISEKINTLFSPVTSSLVSAILLADKSNLSSEIRTYFSLAGIAHILALSGLHIGIIAYILYLVLSFLGNHPLLKFVLFSVLLATFIFLVNAPESAIRAGLMAILIVGGKTFQKDINLLNILSIVVILALLIEPTLVYSVAFQLSVTSVLGIFLFLPLCKNFLENLFKSKSNIINSLSVTFSVSIVTAPIVAYYFGVYSIVSPLANLFLVPLFSLGLILAIVTLVFSFFSGFVAGIFAGSVELIFKICVNITKFISELEFAALLGNEITFSIFLLSIAILYLFLANSRKQIVFRIVVIALFSLAINNISTHKTIDLKTQVFVKPSYTLLSIPLKNQQNEYEQFLWICDRKPDQKFYYDLALVRFIEDNNIKTIGINGQFGRKFINSIDEIVKQNGINVRKLSFTEQKELERRYLTNKIASQIIEI